MSSKLNRALWRTLSGGLAGVVLASILAACGGGGGGEVAGVGTGGTGTGSGSHQLIAPWVLGDVIAERVQRLQKKRSSLASSLC